jgi:geranylgeranyl reductase family protein
MENYDVGIVGAGPVGGFVAGKIAEQGFSVAVFEKNKEIGKILNCAGLVTPRVFDFLEIDKEKIVQNKIKGANIHSPSNNILSIGGDKVHALAIDRCIFDREIINRSKNQGADIFVDNNVLSIQKTGNKIELKTSQNKDFTCNLLIGADGPFSKTRDRFVFPEPLEYVRGIGAEFVDTDLDPGFVEIFVGNELAPGFFAWIIPTNSSGNRARAGLCIKKGAPHSPKHYFDKFLQQNKDMKFLENAKLKKHIGGIIPFGVLKKTFQSNVMLVGDAAAQVKPTSGGGIYTGLLCANHCANIAIDALKKGDFSSNSLKRYHKLWFADIGRELNMGMKLRKIFKNLTDKQFDKYCLKFKNQDLLKIISKYGDIDYPSKLIKPMIKKAPTLLRIIPAMIKNK